MVRKCEEGHVKGDELLEKLWERGIDLKKAKLSKNEIVWIAYDQGIISAEIRDASLVRKQTTIPCYLQTHIQDKEILTCLERYVAEYSMMQSRGSFIANLIANDILGTYDSLNISDFPEQEYALPKILSSADIVKRCFLPERWTSKQLGIDESISECLQIYGAILEPFRSPNYKQIMADTGWDNALNHLGSMYLGNALVQLMSVLKHSLREAIESIACQEQTQRDQLWYLVSKPLSVSSKMHVDDYVKVEKFRRFLRLSQKQSIYDQDILKSMNNLSWTLYAWVVKWKNHTQDAGASLLPVSSIGRKFAYIDAKVAKSLVSSKLRKTNENLTKEHHGSELQKMFGLTPELFNKRREKVRKKLKKKAWGEKNKKRMKKKWRKLGRGVLSKKSIVRSISTDGVGLRLCLETIPGRSKLCYDTFQVTKNTFKVAGDTGRVRIITTVDSNNKVKMITRKAYYNVLRNKRTRAYLEKQMQETEWGAANAAVASSGGFRNINNTTWQASLNALGNNIETIKEYQLYSKEQSFRKMKSLRRKKAFFDQKLKAIIRPSNKDINIVIALGDGDFPCTGKGEQAVPTAQLAVALRRIIKVLNLQRRVRIVILNEFNTTKCCYKCGNVMEKLYTSSGRECLRYRLCRNCCNESIDKRRHRDVNSAKNHMALLECDLQGLNRPLALELPSWLKNQNTSSWVPPIC